MIFLKIGDGDGRLTTRSSLPTTLRASWILLLLLLQFWKYDQRRSPVMVVVACDGSRLCPCPVPDVGMGGNGPDDLVLVVKRLWLE